MIRLVVQVHARVDDVAVGKLSLNLTGLNKESVSVFGTRLSDTFKNLLPFTNCMPLTLEYLNTASLAPKKDYQANRYPFIHIPTTRESYCLQALRKQLVTIKFSVFIIASLCVSDWFLEFFSYPKAHT